MNDSTIDSYPQPANERVSANMRAIRSTGTRPEVTVRSQLHRAGYRFRKHYMIRAGPIKVKPDIVFTRRRVAIFIDGCFWHQCPEHGRLPRRNQGYWIPKLQRNVRRDYLVTEALEAAGWQVIRLWEHVPSSQAVHSITTVLGDSKAKAAP